MQDFENSTLQGIPICHGYINYIATDNNMSSALWITKISWT